MARKQDDPGLSAEWKWRASASSKRSQVQTLLDAVGFNRDGSPQYHHYTDGYSAQAHAQPNCDHQDEQCAANPVHQRYDQSGSSVCQATDPISQQKGIGVWQMPTLEADIADANVSWFYSWGPRMGVFSKPPNTEFVPMIWGLHDLSKESLHHVTQYRHLLAFNEPDIPSQADMSVEQAIEAWPSLMSTGLRLGSPGVADPPDGSDNDWLGRFMCQATIRHYRVDFMCVHYYSRLNTFDVKTNVDALFHFLHKIYNKWQRPIWLTEFAMINWWGGSIGKYANSQEQAEFVQACAAMMSALPFVERYAWFALHKDHVEASNGLYDDRGTLTDVGRTYQRL